MEASRSHDNADARALAEACANAMWQDDLASKGLGISLQRIAPGEAVMSMTVRKDMTNGHGICHGGFIFTLADSAFAFACNSFNERTVAHQCSVTFIKAGRLGDRLVASARAISRSGRSGIYDVRVTANAEENVIAEFRGHSRTIGGTLVADGAAQDGGSS